MSDHSNGVSGAALQALPIGLYVVDRDLRIVAWNAERERGPFGRPAKDVLGRPLSEVLPAPGYEALLPRLRRIFEHAEVLDEVAESPQKGKVRAFRVRRRPVLEDGVVTHVLSLFEDVSIEQERGISVTSAAMQFDYKGFAINLLDTPGHQDFSEDTYRTLTAVDSAVMVIDAAKGSGKPEAGGNQDELQAIRTAIAFEAKGAAFYAKLRDQSTDPKEKAFFGLMAAIEHEHFTSLKDTEEYFVNPGAWFQRVESTNLDGA